MKGAILVTILVISHYCRGDQTSAKQPLDPEVFMNATQLITSKGFPCENYWITTVDGYILNVLRIPHGRKANKTLKEGPKPVVVLQHGLLGAATNYLTNLVNQSLAYILADAGADVWLGNSRGNIYSTNHTYLDPNNEQFWQFSWDEMGKYDLPAMIEFIVKVTKTPQVYYVGHSQGTAIGFAQFGEDSKLASRIKHFFALAPVTLTTHAQTPLTKFAPYAHNISVYFNLLHHGRVRLNETFQKFLSEEFCVSLGSMICASSLFMLCGQDFKSFNVSRLPVYAAHTPAGSSTNTLLHWAQSFNSGRFQKFDYGGDEDNIKHYGQATPPPYKPSNIKIPVSIFRGGQDWMTDGRDIQWLMDQIHVANDIYIEHYAHLDFIWAVDAPDLIYQTIQHVIFS